MNDYDWVKYIVSRVKILRKKNPTHKELIKNFIVPNVIVRKIDLLTSKNVEDC